MSHLRIGTWLTAPNGVPMFDAKKDRPAPRPIVVIGGYGGFLRFLGRSTKPNDDPSFKFEHPPHSGMCERDQACKIFERGYVSLRRRDVWTPLGSQIDDSGPCFEPDEIWLEELHRRTRHLL